MILWQVAGAIFLFRWIFRDPKVDLRLLALGTLLPDVVDLIIGLLVGGITVPRIGHSLLLPTLVAVVILLSTRRGRRRRNLMTLVVAWLFHLVLQGIWLNGPVFLWPALGWELAPILPGSIWSRAAEPWRWLKEAAGLSYLLSINKSSRSSSRQKE
ncbi:MAG: metal-dependent hydrolase [Acidimicrobiia bacterium]